MPKRSNEFQKLVALAQKRFEDQSVKVTESQMLTDLTTGTAREVDICMAGDFAGAFVHICIECSDKSRPVDVGWIDAMVEKHRNLPTNVLILASRSGFTKNARQKANTTGVELWALCDIDDDDLSGKLGSTESLVTKTISLTVEKVVVDVPPQVELPAERIAVSPDNRIYVGAPESQIEQPISTLVATLLKAPAFHQKLMQDAIPDHKHFVLGWNLRSDPHAPLIAMQKLEPFVRRRVDLVEIRGACIVSVDHFVLRKALLGKVRVAWGTTTVSGAPMMIVATESKFGKDTLHVSFEPHPGGKLIA